MIRKLSICGIFAVFAATSFGEKLTMDEAIRLAKQNNGSLKAAQNDLIAARARKVIAASSFMPTITPTASYNDSKQENPNLASSGTSSQASLVWRPLDSGQRLANLKAARDSVSAQGAQTQQTLRQLIFNVEQQFLETLRSQELEKVASAQQIRADKVLDQTKARVQVRDAARREILQAEADSLNAKVNAIGAKNRTNTNSASLKAVIGLQNDYSNPELDSVTFIPSTDLPATIEASVNLGMKARPDLISRRKSVDSQVNSLRGTEIDAGLTWSLDFSYSRKFSPSDGSNRNTSFLLSYPLFDGGKSKALVAAERANVEASRALLLQAERDARSEIESTYMAYQQDQLRLSSAELALRAARLNFEAAEGSQKAGAASLIEVITAQVSLVTAESNFIEATYDVLISQLKLRLVTGLQLPGEDL